ncbi:MAG TPA: thiamine phosphate synthase [Pyrinomonadaceae bacterium]|jgi:thiamine-phosphate pyrophosphorylase
MSSKFLAALDGSQLYPLTDRLLSGLSHADQVQRLSAGGAKLVQLREKIATSAEFCESARAALLAARASGVKIIINDRVDIALALNADGVHLGQDDLPAEAARRLLGPDTIIGLSTHNLTQAQAAATMPVDYIAIGPIFATQSKEAADIPVGLAGLRLIRQAIGNIPLVAIGGITLENCASVLKGGADAVSVISGIWRPPSHAEAQVRRFLAS